MPLIVKKNGTAASVESLTAETREVTFEATLEMVPRNCRLEQYNKVKIPEFPVSGEITAYA